MASYASTSMASHTSVSSTTSLHARLAIPTIGEVPTNDPVVYIIIVILISMIILAVFLLCWTQRRSSQEVWDSVQTRGKFRYLRSSSRFNIDSERPEWDNSNAMEQGLVRICHRIPIADSVYSSDTDSDDEDLSDEEGDALAAVHTSKFEQFWDPPQDVQVARHLTRTPPADTALDGFEQTFDQLETSKIVDSLDGDLGVGPKQKQRASMSKQQFCELYLNGPSIA